MHKKPSCSELAASLRRAATRTGRWHLHRQASNLVQRDIIASPMCRCVVAPRLITRLESEIAAAYAVPLEVLRGEPPA